MCHGVKHWNWFSGLQPMKLRELCFPGLWHFITAESGMLWNYMVKQLQCLRTSCHAMAFHGQKSRVFLNFMRNRCLAVFILKQPRWNRAISKRQTPLRVRGEDGPSHVSMSCWIFSSWPGIEAQFCSWKTHIHIISISIVSLYIYILYVII